MRKENANKNIVLLSDGTGNTTIKNRGTNVFKLYEAIDFNLPHKPQIAFYDDGVGTEDLKPLKILGGAVGLGLTLNVIQLYKELVRVYEEHDKIYLFGFSRGAFTIRTLAGLIVDQGILRHGICESSEELDAKVIELYKNYRNKYQTKLHKRRCSSSDEQQLLNSDICHDAPIEFIGAWDTVDAIGLPFDEAADFINEYIFCFKFPDTRLHKKINKACHAISIDDERHTFHPVMWEEDSTGNSGRIEQVWFPGVHANVGGGYPRQGVSLVALEWMMKKAKQAGLAFAPNDEQFVHDRKNVYDKIYDSRSGLAVYYRYMPRNIIKSYYEKIPVPKIHISTFQRIAEGVSGYSPGNLPAKFEVVDHDGKVSCSDKIADIVGQIYTSTPTFQHDMNKYVCTRRILYYSHPAQRKSTSDLAFSIENQWVTPFSMRVVFRRDGSTYSWHFHC